MRGDQSTRDGHHEGLRVEDAVNAACPLSGGPVAAVTLYRGAVVGFGDAAGRDAFERAIEAFDAALAARRLEASGLPADPDADEA